MAGFSDSFEDAILKLILNATAIANIADNTATAPATAIWVALHTADPTDTGTQGSNEANYTGYTRIATGRTTAAWSVGVTTAGAAHPVSAITFPQATSTSTSTITHASIGLTSSTTSGTIIASGALSPSINIGQNVTPNLTTGTSFTLD